MQHDARRSAGFRLSVSVLALMAAFAPRAGRADTVDGVDEVVVRSERSTSVQGAQNEKRDSTGVTDVMSAEEIAQRPGGDIVDILSHIPGLSGASDMGLGQAATGEQEYVTIRGIDSSYNSYTLNGIRVPQADPSSRALSLKLVAPFGIEAVKVSKTPTVDMDGDAIGGSIDIRTPTAFDFDGDHFKITTQGNYSQLADKTGEDSLGGGVQVEGAHRFNENWGVYASGYYDRKNTAGEAVEATGYTPTLASQATATDWSKTNGLSATGVRYDYYDDQITRYGGNIALDYQDGNQKFYWQSSYANYGVTGNDTQHSILNGLVGLYTNASSYSPVGIMPGSYYQERDETEELLTTKLGGESVFGRLTADYGFSYGYSRIARPNYVEGSLYGVPSVTGSATGIDVSNPANVKVAYDSAATQSYILSQQTDHLWKFQGSDSAEEEKMYTIKGDLNYKVASGWLDTIRAGAEISLSDRYQYQHEFFGNDGDNFVILGQGGVVEPYYAGAGPTVANMPGFNLTSFMNGSYAGQFKVYDRSIFTSSVLPHKYTSQYGIDPSTGLVTGNPGAYTINDYNRNTVSGSEDIYAGYTEANFQVDDFRATLGLRYEQTDFSSSQWVVDGDSGYFQGSSHDYGELLPSLIMAWRPEADEVFRAAIRKSFARPAFGLIASPLTISRNDITGAIAGISEGNPDLKPTEAMNYDVSAEFYGPNATILQVDGYYKTLSRYIYSATTSGAAPSANTATINNGGVVVSEPENGNDATLLGLEVDARHQFVELPGAFSGLGLGGSVTAQHSSADSGRADHFGRKTWLPRAPELMYNFDLFYDKYGVKADLSYQYTGLQLVGLTSNNLDEYLQPIQTLDFSLGYHFLGGATVTFAAKNLMDDVQFYKTLGKTTQYLGTQDAGGNGSYVETGRFFTVSVSYEW